LAFLAGSIHLIASIWSRHLYPEGLRRLCTVPQSLVSSDFSLHFSFRSLRSLCSDRRPVPIGRGCVVSACGMSGCAAIFGDSIAWPSPGLRAPQMRSETARLPRARCRGRAAWRCGGCSAKQNLHFPPQNLHPVQPARCPVSAGRPGPSSGRRWCQSCTGTSVATGSYDRKRNNQ